MSEQQPGQDNTPEAATSQPPMYQQEYYNTAAAVLSGDAAAVSGLVPQHVDRVQTSVNSLTDEDRAVASSIFSPSESHPAATPGNTYQVMEDVATKPTTLASLGEKMGISPEALDAALGKLVDNGVVKRDTWVLKLESPTLNMRSNKPTVLHIVCQAAAELAAESGRDTSYATKTELLDKMVAIDPSLADRKPQAWMVFTKENHEGERSRLQGATAVEGSGTKSWPHVIALSGQHRTTAENIVNALAPVRADVITASELTAPAPESALDKYIAAGLIAPDTVSGGDAVAVTGTDAMITEDVRVLQAKIDVESARNDANEEMDNAVTKVQEAIELMEAAKLPVAAWIAQLVRLRTIAPSDYNVKVEEAAKVGFAVETFSVGALIETLESIKNKI